LDPPVVHQAEGILRARRGVTIDEAARALRAEAGAAGLSVVEVARQIVMSLPMAGTTAHEQSA
ncbi:ANTAR domain-containing protein, partial [Actinomycetospora sp.]|uniref:ANTAR domain-containing protein n=1 Tax=Actinomycetospora sp. TaxID=1872135 RepID=UPI002F40DD7D